jgi:hypothetical protein
MPRSLSAAQQTAIAGETLTPILFTKLDFSGGVVRLTTAPFSVSFDPDGDGVEEFLGVGDLGSISVIEETTEGKVRKAAITLSGVSSALISAAKTQRYRGRRASIWMGWMDDDNLLIGAPVPVMRRGVMDVMEIKRGAGTGSIKLTVLNRLVLWERGIDNPRWSNEDHQQQFPGDKFFEFMPAIVAGKEVAWARD